MWEYRATSVNVVDGDTIDVVIDLGFGLDGLLVRMRLFGIDTPEKTGATKAAGNAATEFTKKWLLANADQDGHVLVVTVRDHSGRDKHDSFGRYLALIWSMDKTANLNEALIASGNTTGRYEGDT